MVVARTKSYVLEPTGVVAFSLDDEGYVSFLCLRLLGHLAIELLLQTQWLGHRDWGDHSHDQAGEVLHRRRSVSVCLCCLERDLADEDYY